MSKQAHTQQHPPLDPVLQTKLVTRFGGEIMKRGFTAISVGVQRLHRSVSGEIIDEEIRCMMPTEYGFLLDLWSYWYNGTTPWPSVKEVDV